MSDASEATFTIGRGWKPIPPPLKVLFVVLILWLVGSVINLPNLIQHGLPLLGHFVYGNTAAAVVLLLDVIGPIVFLSALWNRKSWAPAWAYVYIGAFILNTTVALFTVRETLGLSQLLVPIIASVLFVATIFWKRSYFRLPM